MSGSYYPSEPTPPADHAPMPPTAPAEDCDCSDNGGNLNLGDLLGGSISIGPDLIYANFDGEAGNTDALLSVVAGGDGLLADVSVDVNTDTIGGTGAFGDVSCLLGSIDILDGGLCDGILT